MNLSPAVEKFLDSTIHMLQNDVVKKKIQLMILQPFTQYLIELIFPYIIIICVIFAILISMILSILYILIFKPVAFGNSLPEI